MNKEEKKQFINQLKLELSEAKVLIVTYYHGLAVSDITRLRSDLRSVAAKYKVVKNSLLKLAVAGTEFEQLSNLFLGPTAIAYSKDPVGISKALIKFAKDKESLKLNGGLVECKIINREGIETLATIPSMDELRAKIIGLLSAPATKLVGVIKAPSTKLVRVLDAYASKGLETK